MIKLDHIAVLIAVAAIVALSLWPLKSHDQGGQHEEQQEHNGHDDEHGDGSGVSGTGYALLYDARYDARTSGLLRRS